MQKNNAIFLKYKTAKAWMKLEKKHTYLFLSLCTIFGAYLLPIILANRYYNDDLARSLSGATGWRGDGRPLTELLMKVLCGGSRIFDIAPLPLILSAILLAYTVTLYVRKLFSYEINFLEVFAIALIIMNPFMLENFSYRYDNFSMIVALCVAFIPFILPNKIFAGSLMRRLCWAGCNMVVSITILLIYQAAIGVILSLLLLDILFMLLEGHIDIKRIWIFLGGAGLGCIFYKLILAPHFVDTVGWRARAAKFVPIGAETLPIIWKNAISLLTYMQVYITGMPRMIKILSIIILFFVSIGMTYIIIQKSKGQMRGKRVLSSLYALLLPEMLIITAILPLLVLNSLGTKNRVYISLCIFFFYIGIAVLIISHKCKLNFVLLLLPFIMFSFSYVYIYGNALTCQKNYETYLATSIVHDVETINADNEYEKLVIIGETPRALQLQNICQKYPQFLTMVPVYITNDTWIGGVWLYNFMQEKMDLGEEDDLKYDSINKSEPMIDNSIYSCYTDNRNIIVVFK